MNEQQKTETSNTQSSEMNVEEPANRSFLYHIRYVSWRFFQFFHSLAIYLKPDPAKDEESPPPDQEAATVNKQPPKPEVKKLAKESFRYHIKKVVHNRFSRFFNYPISSMELESSRKFDSKKNTETCPPDDESIDLCCMWAVEFYTPAHVDKLLAGLRKMEIKNRSGIRPSPISQIQEWRQRSHSNAWMDLGTIRPLGTDNSLRAGPLTAPLPPHVQYAIGGLFSLTSSLTCVVIGFVFEKDFSTQFDDALRKNRQTYTKSFRRGYTEYDPVRQKTDHICQIRTETAELAARWFRENLPGIFSSGILGGNLPTCEFVTLRKAEPFPPCSKGNAEPSYYQYLSILDMYSTFDAWQCENTQGLKFSPSKSRDQGPEYHSILAIKKSESDKPVLIQHINREIQYLLSRWAIFPLLVGYSQHLNAIRDSFRSKSRQKSVKILRMLSDHVSYIDIAAVTAELIAYTQNLSWFSLNLGTFKPCNEKSSASDDHTLAKDLCFAIEERAMWLQKTDQSLRDHLTQYGSLLGAEENVRLQRAIRFLTWVILILTLLTVVLSWTELQRLWSVISQWL